MASSTCITSLHVSWLHHRSELDRLARDPCDLDEPVLEGSEGGARVCAYEQDGEWKSWSGVMVSTADNPNVGYMPIYAEDDRQPYIEPGWHYVDSYYDEDTEVLVFVRLRTLS